MATPAGTMCRWMRLAAEATRFLQRSRWPGLGNFRDRSGVANRDPRGPATWVGNLRPSGRKPAWMDNMPPVPFGQGTGVRLLSGWLPRCLFECRTRFRADATTFLSRSTYIDVGNRPERSMRGGLCASECFEPSSNSSWLAEKGRPVAKPCRAAARGAGACWRRDEARRAVDVHHSPEIRARRHGGQMMSALPDPDRK